MEPVEILVPLLNANEPEAKLAGIHVKDGQFVNQGDILFSFETTKATLDSEAPQSGFMHMLPAEVDNIVSVGDLLGWISDKKDDKFEKNQEKRKQEKLGKLRITEPARILASKHGIDIRKIPTDHLVTESIILGLVKETIIDLPDASRIDIERSVLVYGAGGHAKSVMEMIITMGKFEIIGIVDDQVPTKTMVLGFPVLGSRGALDQIRKMGVQLAANGVGGILDIKIRKRIFENLLQTGYSLPSLIHPRAVVEASARINNGVQVFANAYIGSDAILGSCSMVNTNAVVSHDCIIGEYSHIAPGSLLAGHVQVGQESLIGMGVTTAVGIKIGSNVRVGNGAIIYADVPSNTIIPSGKIWAG